MGSREEKPKDKDEAQRSEYKTCRYITEAIMRSLAQKTCSTIAWPMSPSRGAHDAQIFTIDREKLPQALGHDVSHQSAHTPQRKPLQPEIAQTPKQEKSQGMDIGLSL
ncbi:MAG TPA: hypothetical protein VFU86_18975 [Terriglobales bacterium]|nr:hypothetical protein [Terriglobales bacterium]